MEKFEISEEEYAKKSGTIAEETFLTLVKRSFKKEELSNCIFLEKDIGWKFESKLSKKLSLSASHVCDV